MAFEDLDWASDANYPAGSESWSATPTRVAPSAGQQAAGVAPEDVLPAQWFNWLFGNIVEAGQALESRGLQEAWDRAEADGVTTPHLDVGTDDLVVGTDGVPGLFKVNGNTNQVEVNGTVAAVSGAFSSTVAAVSGAFSSTLTAPLSGLSVTGGGSGTRALLFTAGVASDTPIASGSWTPAATVVTGAGVADVDLINTFGRYTRVGNIVSFAFHGTVQTAGWTSGLATMSIPLPISTTHASNDSLSATITMDNAASALADAGDGLRARGESGTDRVTLLMNFAAAFVAGSGSANIAVTGQYIVA